MTRKNNAIKSDGKDCKVSRMGFRASEEDRKTILLNGALECTKVKDSSIRNVLNSQGIREHVCDILEGGRDAFEKREQKYGFKR